MNASVNGNDIFVRLSRRNVASLLAKLDGHPPDSFCTLFKSLDSGYNLIVVGEPDDVHYEELAPGPMHRDTEIALVKE